MSETYNLYEDVIKPAIKDDVEQLAIAIVRAKYGNWGASSIILKPESFPDKKEREMALHIAERLDRIGYKLIEV